MLWNLIALHDCCAWNSYPSHVLLSCLWKSRLQKKSNDEKDRKPEKRHSSLSSKQKEKNLSNREESNEWMRSTQREWFFGCDSTLDFLLVLLFLLLLPNDCRCRLFPDWGLGGSSRTRKDQLLSTERRDGNSDRRSQVSITWLSVACRLSGQS